MAGNFFGNCLCNLCGTTLFITGCTILLVTAFPIAQITIGAVYIYECPAAPAIPVYVMVCGVLALLMMALLALPYLLYPAARSHRIWTLWLLSLVLFVFIWFIYGSYQIYSIHPPNYIKNTIDPNSVNNSIYTPTTLDNKTDLTFENHNKSLSKLNQTWTINNNQTLRSLIQTLALSNISNQTNGEHLNTPAVRRVMAAAPYCDRTVYLFAFWTTTLVYVFAGHALVIITCICGFMKIADIITKHLTP